MKLSLGTIEILEPTYIESPRDQCLPFRRARFTQKIGRLNPPASAYLFFGNKVDIMREFYWFNLNLGVEPCDWDEPVPSYTNAVMRFMGPPLFKGAVPSADEDTRLYTCEVEFEVLAAGNFLP